PAGTLSRDPLGTPPSIGCSVSLTFTAGGPATAVELADGTVITPAQWMSLSGRAQAGGPDRNTRGWIDADGTRHWLDVFAELAPGATTVVVAPFEHVLLLITKSVGSATVTPLTAITRSAVPVLVTVTLCGVLLVPTARLLKTMLVGETAATGPGDDEPPMLSS